MKPFYLSIISVFILTTLSSCFVPTSNFLTQSRLKENNRHFQQEQLEREEQARQEMFRIKSNKALSNVIYKLGQDLYMSLGKGDKVNTNFDEKNIRYYFNTRTAECVASFWWERARKVIYIKGTLIFNENSNTVTFYCTEAENTRFVDRGYIKRLTNGIVYQLR